MVWNLKKLEENKLLKRNYDLCMFSTQALTNDKVYLLVLYMGDGGGGAQQFHVHWNAIIRLTTFDCVRNCFL